MEKNCNAPYGENGENGISVQTFLQWEAASRNVMVIKRCYIDVAGGDLIAGILLSQILFYYLPTKQGESRKVTILHDGIYWLAKRREDWWKECRITAKQFDRASAVLESLGILRTKLYRFNGSPTVHLTPDFPRLLALLQPILPKEENPISPLVEQHELNERKMDIPERGKSNLLKGENPSSRKGKILNKANSITKDKTPSVSLRETSSPIPILVPVALSLQSNGTNLSTDMIEHMPVTITPTWLAQAYNTEKPDALAVVRLPLSPALHKKATQYCKDFPDPAYWHQVFKEAHTAPLLLGLRPSPGHEHFKASFAWFLQKGKNDGIENCVKVFEGKYRDTIVTDDMRLSAKGMKTLQATKRILEEEAQYARDDDRRHAEILRVPQ